MPRLTRTQKFAELRENLANDKETSVSTADLSSYENRLNNITELLTPEQPKVQAPVQKPMIEEKPILDFDNDPKYLWTDFVDTPIDQLVDTFHTDENRKQQAGGFEPQVNPNTVPPISTYNRTQQEPLIKMTDPLSSINDDRVADFEDSIGRIAPSTQKPLIETPIYTSTIQEAPLNEEPVVQAPVNNDQIFDTPVYEAPKAPVYEAPAQPKVETPVYQKPVEAPVYEAPKAPVVETPTPAPVQEKPVVEQADNHAADHSNDYVNSYMRDMIDEVGQYNKMNGQETIGQLTNDMVNQIRNHDEAKDIQEEFVEVPVEMEEVTDDEFSNTVSMEINKIMDEISTDANRVEETVEPVIQPEPVKEPVIETPVVEEHPVLAKALEEEKDENVVEIKNLKDLEAEPQRDTMSNTIPFVVTTGEEEVIEDDDDEEGSNTILNIILIVLIIVLLAVLGLIVFYILKTKGII